MGGPPLSHDGVRFVTAEEAAADRARAQRRLDGDETHPTILICCYLTRTQPQLSLNPLSSDVQQSLESHAEVAGYRDVAVADVVGRVIVECDDPAQASVCVTVTITES